MGYSACAYPARTLLVLAKNGYTKPLTHQQRGTLDLGFGFENRLSLQKYKLPKFSPGTSVYFLASWQRATISSS